MEIINLEKKITIWEWIKRELLFLIGLVLIIGLAVVYGCFLCIPLWSIVVAMIIYFLAFVVLRRFQ